MIYQFDISLKGEGVNEQWRDVADTCKEAAEQFTRSAEEQAEKEPNKYRQAYTMQRASLMLRMAATAYRNASARTLGHGKSERYDQMSVNCYEKSVALEEAARVMREEAKAEKSS
jgi:hypothetical protein